MALFQLRIKCLLAGLVLAVAAPLAAHAGQSCEPAIPDATAVQAQLDMAVRTVERRQAFHDEVPTLLVRRNCGRLLRRGGRGGDQETGGRQGGKTHGRCA